MSDSGVANLSNDPNEAEFLSPTDQLREEIETATAQYDQLDVLISIKSRRRWELAALVGMLCLMLLATCFAFIQSTTSEQYRQFIPALAVFVLFGVYQTWMSYLETNRDLLRLRFLLRRLEAAMAEATDALRDAPAKLPGLPGNVG